MDEMHNKNLRDLAELSVRLSLAESEGSLDDFYELLEPYFELLIEIKKHKKHINNTVNRADIRKEFSNDFISKTISEGTKIIVSESVIQIREIYETLKSEPKKISNYTKKEISDLFGSMNNPDVRREFSIAETAFLRGMCLEKLTNKEREPLVKIIKGYLLDYAPNKAKHAKDTFITVSLKEKTYYETYLTDLKFGFWSNMKAILPDPMMKILKHTKFHSYFSKDKDKSLEGKWKAKVLSDKEEKKYLAYVLNLYSRHSVLGDKAQDIEEEIADAENKAPSTIKKKIQLTKNKWNIL